MNVRNWLKATVGAAAITAMMMAGACTSDGSAGDSTHEYYTTGKWQWGRDRGVSAPAPAPVKQAAKPAPKAETKPAPRRNVNTGRGCNPNVGPNETVVSQAFPTGEMSSSALVVYTIMPKEVRLNQPYEYRLQVCNLTGSELQNVVVTHENQNNMEMVNSSPAASRGADGNPQWVLGNLGPNESEVITVTAKATKTGLSSNCVAATYNNLLCAETTVVEPALALRKTATPQALLCDPIELTYVVTNSGTGACDNVVVKDTLADGMTVNGSRNVSFNAGSLAAGQSKEFKVSAKAGRTGNFSSPASATSGCGADANAAAVSTVVTQPKLTIAAECLDRVYLGRNITFTWNVTNSGDAACDNTTISAPVPAGSTFVSATGGGTLNGNTVVWNAGTISASGGKRSVSMTVSPTGIGTVRAAATAECVCAEQVADTCETRVEGIPAILLEVVDNPDPIRVGDSVTYTITVTNQGSATAKNVAVVCNIPTEQTFVSAGGATNGTASGQTVTFAKLPTLAPKATATFKVVVKANAAGNIRFKTTMTSDVFTTPIEETEATYMYE
jgi:uncharacterized repeat protein (TIGR01451 family)